MAVPKCKTSRTKKRSRRSHHSLGRPTLGPCKNCGSYTPPHQVCPQCGWYKNQVVIPPPQKKEEQKNTP